MAVVSNKNDSAVKALVKHFFGAYIQIAIGESAETARKPDPASVYNALKELGAEKDGAVYVGDSDVDILTAHNAGLPCICVSWGFRERALLKQHGAGYIIDRPNELLDFLQQSLNKEQAVATLMSELKKGKDSAKSDKAWLSEADILAEFGDDV